MQFPKPELLHPYPNGWYVLDRTDALKKGQILNKKFVGEEIVLYRLENGQACASTAFCPHLGAHLGHGGKIAGVVDGGRSCSIGIESTVVGDIYCSNFVMFHMIL